MTEQSAEPTTLREKAQAIAERAIAEGADADSLAKEILALATASSAPYAAALDEIYALRGLVAHEALCVKADTEYASFPKSRREMAANRMERLTQAALGRAQFAVADLNLSPVRKLTGMSASLTSGAYEASLPSRR